MRRTISVLIMSCLVVGCVAFLSYVARAADETPAAPAEPAVAPTETPAETEIPPAETEEAGQQEADGLIKELGVDARTLTVETTELDENDQEVKKSVAFKIDDNAKVTIDGDDAQLKDLRVEDSVLVTYAQDDKGANVASDVAVTRKITQDGYFKSADVAAKQLVIEVVNVDENGKETREDATFILPPEATVSIDGKKAEIKDILPKDQLFVTYLEETPGKKVVTDVSVTRESYDQGTIKTIDINGKKLVLATVTQDAEGKEVKEEKSFVLGADAHVTINDEEGKLDQLKAGDDIWVTYTQVPGGPMIVTSVVQERPPTP